MNYTITASRYANSAHTMAIITTVERDDKVISQADDAALWAQMLAHGEPAAYTADLITYANARQWAVATGGYRYTPTTGGNPIDFATTEASIAVMNAAYNRLSAPNPPTSVRWQTGPTSFSAIPSATFKSAAVAVFDFVQATFDALYSTLTQIQAGSLTTFEQIDALWPPNHN